MRKRTAENDAKVDKLIAAIKGLIRVMKFEAQYENVCQQHTELLATALRAALDIEEPTP
jgi:hypothetical protein